jgi:hypothetical protein
MLIPETTGACIISQKFHKNMLNLHCKCQVFLSGEAYLSAMHAASDSVPMRHLTPVFVTSKPETEGKKGGDVL